MKIVIDIPKELYEANIKEDLDLNDLWDLRTAVKNGIPQPKIGRWIKEKSIYGWDGHSYQCSECGRSIHLDTIMEDLEDYPYCHCGAYMREIKE
jgi:hypothetical protein